MFKQLLQIFMRTIILSCITSLILLLLIYPPHDEGLLVLQIFFSLYFTLIVSLFSLPIFLNLNEDIRSNKYLRTMSFLMLPVFLLLGVTLSAKKEPLFIINTASFNVVLCYFYIKFSRKTDRELEQQNEDTE
jgi:Ca2+/Na+ antiporter